MTMQAVLCSAYMAPSRHSLQDITGRMNTPHYHHERSFFYASGASSSRSLTRSTSPLVLLASALDSETNFNLANETQQQQQQQLTDATIGTMPANTLLYSKNNTYTISHDDDLDLTRQIIMQHIEQIANNEGGKLHWILDDDDEVGGDYEDKQKLETDLIASEETDDAPMLQSASPPPPPSLSSSPEYIEKNTPSVLKILKYTIPAIGVWLCSPVLSMIDTASVGLLSGTAQQAALNPAVSVTDYGAILVAFMYTATTNLIAAAQAQDQDNGSSNDAAPRTTLTLITALKLALVVGSVFGVVLSLLSSTLIKSLIGNDSMDPSVMAAALRYVRIRCFGMPAAVVIGTAQSACLGMQDVKSPLYVLLAAAVINFWGDMLMVPNANPWLGGAAGAAWATVFSQYGAMIMFWKWLTTKPNEGKGLYERKKVKIDWNFFSPHGGNKRGKIDKEENNVVNVTQGIMELTGTSAEGKSRRKRFREFLASHKLLQRIQLQSRYESRLTSSVNSPPKSRGFLADDKLKLRDYLSFSNINMPTVNEFSPFVIPVTTTSIGRISGYIAMVSLNYLLLSFVVIVFYKFLIFCSLNYAVARRIKYTWNI